MDANSDSGVGRVGGGGGGGSGDGGECCNHRPADPGSVDGASPNARGRDNQGPVLTLPNADCYSRALAAQNCHSAMAIHSGGLIPL